jgi:hypothetical protein
MRHGGAEALPAQALRAVKQRRKRAKWAFRRATSKKTQENRDFFAFSSLHARADPLSCSKYKRGLPQYPRGFRDISRENRISKENYGS